MHHCRHLAREFARGIRLEGRRSNAVVEDEANVAGV
jgi:hypothetical protein